MNDSSEAFSRLLDLHTFAYESETYPNHVHITEQEAKKNCEGIWKWIDAGMQDAEAHVLNGVTECFFVLYGEQGKSSVVAYTRREEIQGEDKISAHDVPETVDAVSVLESWLQNDAPIPGLELRPSAVHKVVTFYLLYQSKAEVEKVSDFMNRPTFVTSSGLLVTDEGQAKTVREILTQPPTGHYYQRLCVVFGCVNEESALRLKPSAKQIVSGLITTWGADLERANERAKAAEMEALAWSHEIGNFIRYLTWAGKNNSQHLYELTIDFLEIVTRSAVRMTTLPEVLNSWPRLSAEKVLRRSIDISSRFAVLRDYRGDQEAIKSISGLEENVDKYKSKFAVPEIMDSGLRLAATDSSLGSYQRLAAFAQFVIFALYSAARFSKIESSIQIELSRERFRVTNPIPKLEHGDTRKSEVRAILHQSFLVLWENTRDDFKCGPVENHWITSCDLPDGLWEGVL